MPLTITAPTATTDELAAIDAAIAMWSGHGVDSLVRIADVADLTVAFRAANPESFGYYDNTSATIDLNSALPDDQLGIVVAHELGHAFALVHVAPTVRASVMNPGNLVTLPTDADASALVAVWGACGTSDAP